MAEHQSAGLLLRGCGDLDLESDPGSATGCDEDVIAWERCGLSEIAGLGGGRRA